jgi:hypothetical protein
MKSTLRPEAIQIQNPEQFQLKLQNRFECLENCTDVDIYNDRAMEAVLTVGSKFCKPKRTKRRNKISKTTDDQADGGKE